MAQRFLSPEIIAEGVIKQKGTVTNDEHLITRGYLHGNVLNGIHPDSANYLEVIADGGVNKLKVKPLTITDTTVDATNATLSAFVTNVYTGSNFQEGDIVILSSASPVESYVHNGGTAGTAADWEQINTGLSDAQIRALFSGGNALTYNNTTGQFDVVQDDIRAMFSAGTGLSLSNGQFALNADSDLIAEGVNNLYYADSLVDAHLSGGTAISYNAGVIAFNGTTDDVSQGANNLYYSDTLVDLHLTGGTAISYNSGVISFNGSTSDVSEGTNLYYTDTRVKNALGVKAVTSPDVQLLTYDATAGEYGVALSDVFAEFSAGQGLAFSFGEYSLDANTDDITELSGATNLFFTESRARSAISADPAAGNMLSYDSATGEILVALSDFRKGFQNQSLSKGVSLALTHNLGERLVHVSAMDSNGNKIELDVTYTSSTVVTVLSDVALTGVDIAVSI